MANGPIKTSGWGSNLLKWIGIPIYNSDGSKANMSNSELGKWFKENYSNDFTNSLDNASLGALISQYYNNDWNAFGLSQESLDLDSLLADLNALSEADMSMPQAPNYGDLYEQAQEAINTENQELLNLLAQNMDRQTEAYNNELTNLNNAYNDYARQTLSNNYMNNASLLGTVGSEMSKARQNALEAGASAGLRLAENVNTLLSVQNKQSQISLDTSNNLAQQLLNQRQAASGIRSNYENALTNNTNQQIGIKQGTAERTQNYANSLFGTQQNIYQNDMQNWEDAYGSKYGSNPFSEAYKNYNRQNAYANTNSSGGARGSKSVY